MKNIIFAVITLIAFGSCQKKPSFEPKSYFTQEELKSIVKQLIPRIEKRYTDFEMKRQKGMDSLWLENCYIHALYLDETGRHKYLYIQKDVFSEIDKSRAVIGSFLLNEEDSVISVYQDYISYRTLTDVAIEKGTMYFELLVREESLNEYMGKQGHIQWPGSGVKFNYETEKWEY